jgi:hypothetical protein
MLQQSSAGIACISKPIYSMIELTVSIVEKKKVFKQILKRLAALDN